MTLSDNPFSPPPEIYFVNDETEELTNQILAHKINTPYTEPVAKEAIVVRVNGIVIDDDEYSVTRTITKGGEPFSNSIQSVVLDTSAVTTYVATYTIKYKMKEYKLIRTST